MQIAALGGSLRPSSFAYQVLHLALQKIEDKSITTDLIDLRHLHLPFCDGSTNYPDYPDVALLRQRIQAAKGLLIATPEYHGSVSGVLKNALDLLEEEHMAGKVVGLIAVTGGVHSTNALNTLRVICRQMRCWVLPEQVVIPHTEESFDEQGKLKDFHLEKRVEELVGHLVQATRQLKG